MKKLFAILFLFSLPFAPASAQGLHGRILIVRDSSSDGPNDLENVLPSIYFGSIDTMLFLPADLSKYDAVLVKDDTLSVADKLSLIDYVKGKGKLYIESSLPFPLDTLLQFLGLTDGFGDALVARYSEFLGVDSEFTKGLNVPHAEGDPTEYDLLESYIPVGSFIPVLYGKWIGNNIFAWIPADTSLRVVVHYHPAFYDGHVAEYYNPFLTRVLCDYFGLCTDAVHETPQVVPAIALRVIYDGPRTDLQIKGEEQSEVDVSNALGVIVFRASTQSGTSLVELPATLPDGFYFARVQSESGVKVQPFSIFAR